MHSVRRRRSTANNWDALATESFVSPESFAASSVCPGAVAHVKLLVSGTHTTIVSRLRLSALP